MQRSIIAMNLTEHSYSIFDQKGIKIDTISYRTAVEKYGPPIAVS